MKLSNKMVKNFCEMLTMLDAVDSPQLGEMNNIGVKVSIRDAHKELGAPEDWMIISGAASFRLPLSCPALFAFFTMEEIRPKVVLNTS